ncbi:hypothetical protein V500_01586 [Pseudogymnoascus sp. VKM F-4518 (FW-2643)]|nr:hypothetical protein V500_01586 [Pseudogymnoascus sp. VKM F-4518 (FW-2643)]
MHNIVILGGNFSGVPTAHYLLRHVLPNLNRANSDNPKYVVTLISPSDHTFFKVAAPRALLSADKSLYDKPFASIPSGFKNYDSSVFSFIQGEAVKVDEAANTVSVKLTNDNKPISVQYNSLVIATGTISSSPLWTLHGDYKLAKDTSADILKQLPTAKTILIAGGGAVGVETAGEVAYNYSGKNITLLSGGTRLLPRLKHTGIAKTAEKQLASLKVKILHNIKVTSSTELPDGKVSVKLSDGSTRILDVFIDATGGTPNTNFLPADWLDDRKRVVTDMATLRATKAPAGVYSLGDVASFSKNNIMDAGWSVPPLCYSIWSDLHDKSTGGNALKEKTYKQIEADMQIVPIGPNGGVGVIFGWQIPNFLVRSLKSKTYFMEKAAGMATGEDVLKA